MKSTGEVMGIDDDFAKAFLKSQLGSGISLPLAGTLFVSVKDSDKGAITLRSGRCASWASR
jgi:carbamoyl-phosphate synthase large subunit